jgi:hypothetical protein
MLTRLFVRTTVPAHHRLDGVAREVRWVTWSPAVIRRIKDAFEPLVALPVPRQISVRGCEPYDATYSYRLSDLNEPLRCFATETAEALLRVRIGKSLTFFSRMFDPPMSPLLFHKCMALMRFGVVQLTGDPRTALDAPVKPERHDDGFPLHADLFLTERLWLIFDDVPTGHSGKALFLRRDVFDRVVSMNPLVSAGTRRRIRTLLDRAGGQDSFDEFFDLIYSAKHPWSRSLVRILRNRSWAIKFRRGEGYLINDKHWLHGRTPVRGKVSHARFRRLIYGRMM